MRNQTQLNSPWCRFAALLINHDSAQHPKLGCALCIVDVRCEPVGGSAIRCRTARDARNVESPNKNCMSVNEKH